MKKYLFGLVLVIALFLVGCEKIGGDYTKGVYFGSSEYTSYGVKYVATAVVTVNDQGKIESVFIDATYNKDGVNTTKKVLGEAYGMAAVSKKLEWDKQINLLETKIVEEQGLSWFKYSDTENTEIDSVSGVTISVNNYHDAVKMALDQAKK